MAAQPNNILALDQSSRVTGWSVYINGELIRHGKFTVDDQDTRIRLYKIREKVRELIEDNDIQLLVLEDIYLDGVRANVQTFKILAEVFGVLRELSYEAAIQCDSVLAQVWKSALKLKRKNSTEEKKATQQYVLDNFKVKATYDECDAICIGHYYVSQKQEEDFNWG